MVMGEIINRLRPSSKEEVTKSGISQHDREGEGGIQYVDWKSLKKFGKPQKPWATVTLGEW